MTTAPLLDTHSWVWWLEGNARLRPSEVERLDALPADDRPYLSDISLWEVAMLVERNRLSFSMPLGDWLEAATHPRSVRVIPITPAIAAEVATLPNTFHRDPADRLIVATARVLALSVLTRDARIRRSRLVSLWKTAG